MQQETECNNPIQHGYESSERKPYVPKRSGMESNVYVCYAMPDY